MKKFIKIPITSFFLFCSACFSYIVSRLFLSKPIYSGELSLSCLDEPVRVIYDKAGIPHIYAQSLADGYRALGYLMAQERVVQMQMMLRIASGTLSEVIGKMGLEVDIFMRKIGLRRKAAILASLLEEDAHICLESYCEGLNEYLKKPRMKLPFEFMIIGGKPERWKPEDCLTLGLFTMWLLDSFWPADLVREKLARILGWERARELLPQTSEINNPPYKVDGRGCDARPEEPGEEIDWGFDKGVKEEILTHSFFGRTAFGSNNWVLSGERTESGKPILACDPHIQHNAPGVLFLFHLNCPDFDAIGACFPGVPVIAYGHNGYCGWAATSLCPDVQDLFVVTFESEDSERYLFDGEWVEAEKIEEEIRVRFSRSLKLNVLITKHGPVIKRRGNKGLALKWIGHEISEDTLGAFLRQNRAKSFKEFVEAMRGFTGPAMNQVYADVDGNIGYLAAAKVPIRARGDGSIPLDGSSSDSCWVGYIPFDDMPKTLNPPEGFIVTANSKCTTDGYPYLITTAWEAPYRNARITELIKEKEKHTLLDMRKIHSDVFTFTGKTFAKMVVSAANGRQLEKEVEEAVKYLSDWDYQARADSVAMTIYFFSWNKLCEFLLRHKLGSTLFEEYMCGWTNPKLAVEEILKGKDPFWLPRQFNSYDELVIESLAEGIRELKKVFGDSRMEEWKWGRIHHLTCQHLLGLAWPLNKIFNVGPVPRDGEGDTVNASPPMSDCLSQLLARGTLGGSISMPLLPDKSSHAAYGGPVLRMVIDFSDLDRSMVVLDVGQSGHRLSPHYKDHFQKWLNVDYFPLPYTRKAVEKEKESELLLLPG